MKKSYHFCTHWISIVLFVMIGTGLAVYTVWQNNLDIRLLAVCEALLLLYCVYIWWAFSLTIDDRGIRLQKAQNLIDIEWDQISSISIVEQMSTRRVMLRVAPKQFVKGKKAGFFLTKSSETMETDVELRYIKPIQQFYQGEILGMNRLQKRLNEKKEKHG